MPDITTYRSTGDAYNMSQSGLPNGTMLHVPTERVVGISTCWPLAVTVETGELHGVKPDADPERLLRDAKITPQHVQAAAALARSMGYELAPWVAELAAWVAPTGTAS